MVYTLTINPSLDYVMEMDELFVGKMNRSKSEYMLPGGKGINVSQVLKQLEIDNVAILPVAGFTGEKLLKMLSEKGIDSDAVFLKEGDTRINVKVLGEKETELNAGGPAMSDMEKAYLMQKLDCIKDGDYLVLSGSVPTSLGEHFYADIMDFLQKKKIHVVVDTIGVNFCSALRRKPFLIKPNKEEMENFFNVKADTKEQLMNFAAKLKEMGAGNVLLSLGPDGAILLTDEGKVFERKAPKGKVINSVGAGDSMVAGFLAGYIKKGDMEMALKWGIAAGSASAFSKNLATKQEIDALMEIL